eukprot:COSAG04_NODE_2070_length_4866_cov_72.921334_5_plen_356_part_00
MSTVRVPSCKPNNPRRRPATAPAAPAPPRPLTNGAAAPSAGSGALGARSGGRSADVCGSVSPRRQLPMGAAHRRLHGLQGPRRARARAAPLFLQSWRSAPKGIQLDAALAGAEPGASFWAQVKRANFGLPSDRLRRWCGTCARQHEGAIDVVNKRCEDCQKKRPNFGMPDERKARWCAPAPPPAPTPLTLALRPGATAARKSTRARRTSSASAARSARISSPRTACPRTTSSDGASRARPSTRARSTSWARRRAASEVPPRPPHPPKTIPLSLTRPCVVFPASAAQAIPNPTPIPQPVGMAAGQSQAVAVVAETAPSLRRHPVPVPVEQPPEKRQVCHRPFPGQEIPFGFPFCRG